MPEAPLPLEESHPHLRQFLAFLNELNKESERGAVLISAAMLDEILSNCIHAFLLDHNDVKRLLQGFNAPLGTLSARSLAAFALGLLSEREYGECDRLRKIRNLFAHNVHASFTDQKLMDLCGNLTYSAKDYGQVAVDARGQFTTAAVGLILNLTNRAHYARARRLTYSEWEY